MTLSLGPDFQEISRAAVFGLARSGRAAVDALLTRGVSVVGTDSRSADALEPLPEHPAFNAVLGSHPEALLDDVDLVVVSPGIPLVLPIFDAARARAIPVVSEIELASRLLPGLVVGVTGTNGKSTTTALIAALLNDAGLDAVACGNFGTPWIQFAGSADTSYSPGRVWVVELSSFQLEGIRRFAPDVAVHLNLTPDHLDRYRSLDDYGAAKARIFENQREAQVAVVNADDPLVTRIHTRARRLEFSRVRLPEQGVGFAAGRFVWVDRRKGERVFAERADLSLPGAHNLENALAALAATVALGVTPESAVKTFRSFRGLPHRTELVATRRGVAFYNDSKGTNVDATLKSLEGFADGSVWLILGGKDKGDDFARLAPLVSRKARRVLTIGAAGDSIAQALESTSPGVAITRAATLTCAIDEAAQGAVSGDTVLLSPACASFDQFKNFEHRGEVFTSLVKAL
ncbi:MAG: UDP-N-acetylmuramoyl-L-alanine--D-glutamate ligase, partial [Thermoanaerobaculia bacterium]